MKCGNYYSHLFNLYIEILFKNKLTNNFSTTIYYLSKVNLIRIPKL